jgi:TfoX/Sxy family transcriptional regulator of competence genes
MAFDEQLAERIRAVLEGRPDVQERRMFGGIAFLLSGHMACGIVGTDLMVRLGREGTESALAEPHVRPMDFTGRPSSTMVFVDREGTASDGALAAWVHRAADHARTLPAKARPTSPRKGG